MVASPTARLGFAAKRLPWSCPWLLGIPVALLFAVAARLPYFVGSDFPLNDGGMFLTMAADIRAARYSLPDSTSYNFDAIPFAYPPLSFYIVAILSRLTGVDPIALVRYLPLVANLATVVAAAILARSLLGPGWSALLAPIIFALVPRSYEWMIMGGGLTRSAGFLSALVCLSLAGSLYAAPTAKRLALCCVFAALALATHLELGLFTLYSLVLMSLFYGRSVGALLSTAAVGLAMVSLTAPWWATVISRHGLAPFEAASQTAGWAGLEAHLALLQRFTFPPNPLLALVGASAVLGAIACVIRGELFLPVWLPSIFFLTPRSAENEATVPLALLAAIGLAEVVRPGLAHALHDRERSRLSTAAGALFRRAPRTGVASISAAGGALALLLGAVFLYWPRMHLSEHTLNSLSTADRQAMRWIFENTPQTAQLLVVSTTWSWEEDRVGEWFPVIAGRRSVLTPQGSEWLPDELHARKLCLWGKVRDLAAKGRTVEELDEWARDRGIAFSHIYISKVAHGSVYWGTLVASAIESRNYTVPIDNDDVTVLQRTEPIRPRWEQSGELAVGRDCVSLADEPEETQNAFEAAHGPFAARAWLEEHLEAIGRRPSLSGRLSEFGLVGPGR